MASRRFEQRRRQELRLADQRGVQVARLIVGDAFGRRVEERRHQRLPQVRHQQVDGGFEVVAPVAEIAAQRDGDSRHEMSRLTARSSSGRAGRRRRCWRPACGVPRRSSRPARASSKNRVCSMTSPTIDVEQLAVARVAHVGRASPATCRRRPDRRAGRPRGWPARPPRPCRPARPGRGGFAGTSAPRSIRASRSHCTWISSRPITYW